MVSSQPLREPGSTWMSFLCPPPPNHCPVLPNWLGLCAGTDLSAGWAEGGEGVHNCVIIVQSWPMGCWQCSLCAAWAASIWLSSAPDVVPAPWCFCSLICRCRWLQA